MNVGGISDKYMSNTVSTSKNKAADSEFEQRLQSAVNKNDDKELKKACQEFEGLMLGILYKQMKATIPKSDLFPKDSGTEMFESMLDDQLVEEASKNGTSGLGNMLYKQLSKDLKDFVRPDKVANQYNVEKSEESQVEFGEKRNDGKG